MPQLRQNIITGDWVIIAPERAKRPEDFIQAMPKTKSSPKDCLFCPNGGAIKTKIQSASTKNVIVIPNKFPAFVKKETIQFSGSELYYSQKSTGGHEVIIFANHYKDFAQLTEKEICQILEIYRQRLRFYNDQAQIEYTLIIHNHGFEAAASIDHPHSQILASSIMPPVILNELANCQKYFQENSSCPFCDMIATEQQEAERIVFENSDFIAFCFFAARMPFEIWVLPKKHLVNFEDFNQDKIQKLTEVLKMVLTQLSIALADPPYNFYLHTMPAKRDHLENFYHFHIEILPRLSRIGGYELGAGIWIDVVSPERAAEFLKNAKNI